MPSACLPDVRQEVEKDIDIEIEKDGEMEKAMPLLFFMENIKMFVYQMMNTKRCKTSYIIIPIQSLKIIKTIM